MSIRLNGSDSKETSSILYQLCIHYKEIGDYRKSWEYLEECIRIHQHLDPPDYAALGDCVNDRAVLLSCQGLTGDYMEIYREALIAFEKGCPEGHPEMAVNLSNIGTELSGEEKFDEALVFFRRAMTMVELFRLPQHPDCLLLRGNLANCLIRLGKYEEALDLEREFVKRMTAFPGPDHEDAALARLVLCQAIDTVLYCQENAPKKSLREEAMAQCAAVKRAKRSTVLGWLALSDSFHRTADLELSRYAREAALRGCRGYVESNRNEPANWASAECFSQAVHLVATDRPLAEVADQIMSCWREFGPELSVQADFLIRTRKRIEGLLIWVAQSRIQRQDDTASLQTAFQLVSDLGGVGIETVSALASFIVMLFRRRLYAESDPLCALVTAKSAACLGKSHANTLLYLQNHAVVKQKLGNLAAAEGLFRLAFERTLAQYGTGHVRTLELMSNLVTCRLRKGEESEAETELRAFLSSLAPESGATSARHFLSMSFNNRALEMKNEYGEYQTARQCYAFGLEAEPTNGRIHANLSLLMWVGLGDINAAEEHFQQSLRLDAGSGGVFSNYGLFLTHAKRDFIKAATHFENAVALSPHEAGIHGNYTTLLVLQGELEKAWVHAKRDMSLCLIAPDRLMARSLFCAAAILLLRGQAPTVPLGQLKRLFNYGIDCAPWVITELLHFLEARLTPDWARLLGKASEAITRKSGLAELKALPLWEAIAPVEFDVPWPEDAQKTMAGSLPQEASVFSSHQS